MWYIVAHCESNAALRFYRIDRITSVTPTDEEYGIPDDFRLEAVLRDGRPLSGEPQGVMRVRYGPRIARWIAEREGKTPDEDGSLVMDHPIHDPHWALRHLMQYGPDAEVLAPDSLRHAMVRQLEAMSTGT